MSVDVARRRNASALPAMPAKLSYLERRTRMDGKRDLILMGSWGSIDSHMRLAASRRGMVSV